MTNASLFSARDARTVELVALQRQLDTLEKRVTSLSLPEQIEYKKLKRQIAAIQEVDGLPTDSGLTNHTV